MTLHGLGFMAVLAGLHPVTASAQGTGTWNGGVGEWITIDPLDWILVDFTSPWGTFPDGQVFTFINTGQVNLQQKSLFDEELEQWVPINAVSVAGLSVGSGATLFVTGSTTFTAGGFLGIDSNVLNDGLIQFENTASLVSPLLLTIAGDGTIFLRGDPAGGSDENTITGPGTIFHLGDHTITGRGTIQTVNFHNSATVQASLAGMTLKVTSLFLNNSGLMRAINGALLRLTPSLSMENTGVVEAASGNVEIDTPDLENDGTLAVADDTGAVLRLLDTDVDNSGGLLTVGRLGVMELHHGTTIRGGTMTAADTGLFRVASGEATLRNAISLTGRLQVSAGTSLELNAANLTQPAGTLEVLGGGLMRVSGASSITGGLLTGAGQFTAAGGLGLHGGAGGLRIEGLDVQVGGVPLTTSATIENNTTITVAPQAAVQVGSGSLFTGTGDWVFTPAFDFYGVPLPGAYATVGQTGGGVLTLDTDARIRGSARLGINQINLLNRGIIRADAADGAAIQLEFSGRTLTNENLIESAGTGRIDVLAGTYLNENGVFRAGSGTDITFHSNATLRGGTVESTGTGLIKSIGGVSFDGATAGPVTFGGQVRTTGTLTLLGEIENNAQWEIGDGTWTTPADGLTLSGTGTMRGVGGLNAAVAVPYIPRSVWNLGGPVLNVADHTLAGALLLYTGGWLINEGTILADDPRTVPYNFEHGHPLWIAPGGGTVINRGTLAAANDAHLVLDAGVYLNDGGVIEGRPGGSVDLFPGAIIRGGAIDSAGTGFVRTAIYLDGLGGSDGSGVVRLERGTDGPVDIRGLLQHSGHLTLAFQDALRVSGTLEMSWGGGRILRAETSVGGTEALLFGPGATLGRPDGAGIGVITATDGSTMRIDTDHTVGGQLRMDFRGAHLVNDGAIIAEKLGQAGHAFTIQLRDHDLVNRGVIGARNAGTLFLDSTATAVLDNRDGSIAPEAGGSVVIGGGTVRGGAFAGTGGIFTPSGAQVHLDGTTAGPITNTGNLRLRTGTGTFFTPTYTRFYGEFINHGLIEGDNTGYIQAAAGQTTTFSGTGEIVLGNASGRGFLSGEAGSTLVIGPQQTLRGAFTLTHNTGLTVVNQGTIRADNPSQIIILGENAATVVQNQGLIEATGATLRLSGGLIDQTGGGVIRVREGGVLQGWWGTVKGGRIESEGSGYLSLWGLSLRLNDGVTLAATTHVGSTGVLYLGGTNTNDGTVYFKPGSRLHPLADGAVLNGNGRLVVTDNATTDVNAEQFLAAGPLTIGAGQRVEVDNGSLLRLWVPVSGNATWRMNGVVFVASGGSFDLGAEGRFEGTGGIRFEGASTHTLAGTISPGNDGGIGLLTFDNHRTLHFTADSRLEFGLGGAQAGEFDRLHFTAGTSIFASELDVTFLNGFLPAATDVFDLITGIGLTGSFSNVLDGRLDVSGLGSFAVNFTGTYLRLSGFEAVAIPEPSTVALVLGLLALGAAGTWRRRRAGIG
ncbi:MAG: PEP-CTERM sorting domain-containing protein [Opitutaceae bacterium]|nr:PEP-CTERM sorting domain-containing protein [Opitutaceae bacterium]